MSGSVFHKFGVILAEILFVPDWWSSVLYVIMWKQSCSVYGEEAMNCVLRKFRWTWLMRISVCFLCLGAGVMNAGG